MIRIELVDTGDRYTACASQILEVDSQGMLVEIAPGYEDTTLAKLRPGKIVDLVQTETESTAQVKSRLAEPKDLRKPVSYVASVKVRGYREGSPLAMYVEHPERIVKRPPRRFFRVNVELPVHCNGFHGTSVNLSASGVLARFPADQIVQEGARYELILMLPGEPIEVSALAIRRLPETGTPGSKVGPPVAFEFIEIPMSVQDHITRFLFDQQRQAKRRRL